MVKLATTTDQLLRGSFSSITAIRHSVQINIEEIEALPACGWREQSIMAGDPGFKATVNADTASYPPPALFIHLWPHRGWLTAGVIMVSLLYTCNGAATWLSVRFDCFRHMRSHDIVTPTIRFMSATSWLKPHFSLFANKSQIPRPWVLTRVCSSSSVFCPFGLTTNTKSMGVSDDSCYLSVSTRF